MESMLHLPNLPRPQGRISLDRNPTCCFCWLIVDLEEDREAQERDDDRLGPAHSSEVRQLVYSHSDCLHERIHPAMVAWKGVVSAPPDQLIA
ncbi:hypothetical protein ACIP6I_30555 [Streptomyces anulatus]